jgi:hypothetical protein
MISAKPIYDDRGLLAGEDQPFLHHPNSPHPAQARYAPAANTVLQSCFMLTSVDADLSSVRTAQHLKS